MHLVSSHLLESCGQRRLISHLSFKIVSAHTAGDLLPRCSVLFSRSLSFSITLRSMQFLLDTIWKQRLGTRVGPRAVIQLKSTDVGQNGWESLLEVEWYLLSTVEVYFLLSVLKKQTDKKHETKVP